MMPDESAQTRSTQDTSPRGRQPSPPPTLEAEPASLIGDRDREAFLDVLSHELRTPVTTIYGGAELLASREMSPARTRALAEDVRVEAERLYRVVEDLVVLARSERDGIRPAGEPVAIGRLVVLAIEHELAQHTDLRILLLGESDAAADGADEVMVAHVVRNLLDNAIRYGGDAQPIEVVVEVTAGEVAVRVIDRGKPPGEDREPFGLSARRRTTAAARAGAGIGLFVANRLVTAMRGRMWAKPSPADGAEFGFALARFDPGTAEQTSQGEAPANTETETAGQ
jgi:two-component system phosphate regulon sensor histidine kinase PhoR